MRISFFGHADFYETELIRKSLTSILRDAVQEDNTDFFFGGYGCFDSFAYSCAREFAEANKVKLIFVTPYITESYQRNQLDYDIYKYDEVIYPALEKVPPRFAISARNRWMVENSDIVITYINYSRGGAYNAYLHAMRKKVRVINLGRLNS